MLTTTITIETAHSRASCCGCVRSTVTIRPGPFVLHPQFTVDDDGSPVAGRALDRARQRTQAGAPGTGDDQVGVGGCG